MKERTSRLVEGISHFTTSEYIEYVEEEIDIEVESTMLRERKNLLNDLFLKWIYDITKNRQDNPAEYMEDTFKKICKENDVEDVDIILKTDDKADKFQKILSKIMETVKEKEENEIDTVLQEEDIIAETIKKVEDLILEKQEQFQKDEKLSTKTHQKQSSNGKGPSVSEYTTRRVKVDDFASSSDSSHLSEMEMEETEKTGEEVEEEPETLYSPRREDEFSD